MRKIIILTSHPIQYQAPFFKEINLNKDIELKVFFEQKNNLNNSGFFDKQFNRKIKWDIPLLEGYNFYYIKNLFDFCKKIKKEKPDAILIFGWDSFYKRFIILFSNLFKTKIFVRSENPLNQEQRKNGLKQWIKKIILKVLFRRISAFLYIGEQNRKFYKSYGIPEEKLFFIPYSVDNKRLQNSYNNLKLRKQVFRNELNIKEEDVVVLFVGKFIYKKRPLHLLRAYKKVLDLHKDGNKIHLIFVGEGELRGEMEDYIDKNNLSDVYLVGFKNQTELPEYYTMSDIFVLPSGIGETWGLVTNEAMNFELPIIISNMPGSGYDLVKEGENGYMFKLGDIDDLSSKISELVENKEKRENFGKKSFEIINNYNYEKDVKGILKALNINQK